jgi:hypothetical protein
MNSTGNYLASVKKQFFYYKTLGEKAMAQLQPEQLFMAPNEESNSIATIVKHLHGNMLSRWTDFLSSDGEKSWRKRDEEFENDLTDKTQVLALWQEGWNCLFAALDSLSPEQLTAIIYIRNEGHTVMDAINRQLAHYPYHVGQMVYAAKMLKKGEWQSLSIPRNKSGEYNAGKFAQDKAVRHFTDDELKKLHQNSSLE